MRKAFSLAFFVIGLIALATLLVLKSPSERRGETLSQVFKKEALKPAQKVTKEVEKKAPEIRKESLSKRFLNSQLPMEERLDAWLILNKEKTVPAEVLREIAIAPNPFENQKKTPHTTAELNFRREEGFRIMALQELEKQALKNPASLRLIEAVARTASSPSVRKIAQKMSEFARQGKSYSSLFEQAVMNLEIPQ